MLLQLLLLLLLLSVCILPDFLFTDLFLAWLWSTLSYANTACHERNTKATVWGFPPYPGDRSPRSSSNTDPDTTI